MAGFGRFQGEGQIRMAASEFKAISAFVELALQNLVKPSFARITP
jgi:hypothetical protein